MNIGTWPARAGFMCLVVICNQVLASDTDALEKERYNIEEVVVTAHPLSAEGLAQPVSVISADALQRIVAPSIGETLNNISGIHSSSFGQAVGRPIIRGLAGPRVKTMEDRIDSLDVSVSSPDHLTTIDTLTANSIEILKGPSTLLYGTGAIGGVVDVHTGRIPHLIPERPTLMLDTRGADNGDRRSSAARFDVGGGGFAVHVDGFYRESDQYEIPRFAESAVLRQQEAMHGDVGEHSDEDHDEDHEGEDEAYGELPGSQYRTHGGSMGISRVGERGFIGLAVSSYDGEYGLPGGHHHHDEGHATDEEGEEDHENHEAGEESSPNLKFDQTKIDIELGVLEPISGIESVNFRMGRNDYEHTEVEGNGEIGTTFSTKAWEGRLELVHDLALGVKGSLGLQASNREFAAIGEEAFVAPVDTDSFGVFYVGERDFGSYNLEAGVRIEQVKHSPTGNRSKRFTLEAASIGLIKSIGDKWELTVQFDRSNRAPVAEELYSNGAHLATGSYEIGDPNLGKETANNIAASLRYESSVLTLGLNLYRTDFSDYIFESPTGAEEGELPVLLWQQNDALFRGFEADLDWQAVSWDAGALSFSLGADLIRAALSGTLDDDLPRLPPRRWWLGVELEQNEFVFQLTYRKTADQNNVSPGELASDGYEDVSAYLGYHSMFGNSNIEVFVRGTNLTDDEQRYHTSFIKDLAPQPGRTIEGGITIRI